MRTFFLLTVLFLSAGSWAQADSPFIPVYSYAIGAPGGLGPVAGGEPLPPLPAMTVFPFLAPGAHVALERMVFDEEKYRAEKKLIDIALISCPFGILGGVALALNLPELGWPLIGVCAVSAIVFLII